MSLPQLPVQEQVANELDKWEEFHHHIGGMISQIKALRKAHQNQRKGVDSVRSLFAQYVTPKYPGKTFNPSAVCVQRDSCYDYQHDGVHINVLGRETWHLGDYDMFYDRHITVDGDRLFDEYKQ